MGEISSREYLFFGLVGSIHRCRQEAVKMAPPLELTCPHLKRWLTSKP